MGFGSIIATGIMVVVLIVTGYLIVASLNYSVDSASAAMATMRDGRVDRMNTALALSDVSAGARHLDFNVTNTGESRIGDIASIDVIVKAIVGDQVTQCTWFPYNNDTTSGADHWYVLYQVKESPGSSASLSPGDVMRIRCIPDSDWLSDMGEIEITTAGGTRATRLYHVAME